MSICTTFLLTGRLAFLRHSIQYLLPYLVLRGYYLSDVPAILVPTNSHDPHATTAPS
jgi:hypothetical protein